MQHMKTKVIKKEIRVLGIDDSPFDKHKKGNCLVVCTVFRGASFMDGLISFHVTVDGYDATQAIIKHVKASKHYKQLNCIMINGIALAGFNVVDIQEINKQLKLPVIIVTRRKPNIDNIKRILKRLKQEEKIKLIEKAGTPKTVIIKNKPIYFQHAGISEEIAADIIKLTAVHGLMPEPLRIAHIIASGVVLGENRGRV